jgi:beta-lactam-binding protein with PASTA domain
MTKKNNNSLPVVEILKKVFNHYIVKNVLIFIFAGVVILYATLVFLRHYTHHGEMLTVPDVGGLTLEEAGNLLQAKKMRWQLSDSVYVNTEKPGAVIHQNPEPGSKVKENRNIFLVINALAPEKVKMPNVVDLSYRQAKSTLESQGLTVGELIYVPYIAENYVLKQLYKGEEIRRGTEIVKGSVIDLELGRGLSDEKTPVPNLLGNTLNEARRILAQYFLNFGVPIYDNTVITSADTVNAFIFQQRPAAGEDAMLQLGSPIDVWLTVDETKKPEILNETESE